MAVVIVIVILGLIVFLMNVDESKGDNVDNGGDW